MSRPYNNQGYNPTSLNNTNNPAPGQYTYPSPNQPQNQHPNVIPNGTHFQGQQYMPPNQSQLQSQQQQFIPPPQRAVFQPPVPITNINSNAPKPYQPAPSNN